MRAGLYLRTSSIKQIDDTNLDIQEAGCRKYCQAMGYDVVDVQRMEAAKFDNNQKVNDLIDYATRMKGKIDVIVVHLSRFSRLLEHRELKSKLSKMSIVLRIASESTDESSKIKLIEGIQACMRQFDKDIRIEKIKRAKLLNNSRVNL